MRLTDAEATSADEACEGKHCGGSPRAFVRRVRGAVGGRDVRASDAAAESESPPEA